MIFKRKWIFEVLGGAMALLLSGSVALGAEQVHIVKRSETLSELARRYGVSTALLIQHNHIKNPSLLRPGQRLIIPEGQEADSHYTVQKGDSLASIAKSHGLTMATMIKRNDLDHPDRLVPGQTLLIPGGAEAGRTWNLPDDLETRLDALNCSRRWKTIVIHHSGSKWDSPQSMDAYHHRRGMENGLAYHFVIGNGQRTGDGAIYVGRRWEDQLDGGHLASLAQNHRCIGICLVGDFNITSPSPKQMAALRNLVGYLLDRCSLDKRQVVTHRDINVRPTQCPGKRFPMTRVLAGL